LIHFYKRYENVFDGFDPSLLHTALEFFALT